MGKAKKKSDFQKIKLKAGKKLPRGLNETIATFKTRSIEIKSQTKKASSFDIKKRDVNIEVIFTQ